jgi:hypothetical protein
MAQSAGLHEPEDRLSSEVIYRHRALTSIQEELEAAILAHNRDEKKEHASMVLEWLRRQDPVLDQHLRTYLFSSGSITGVEASAEDGASDGSGSLGIGSLKGAAQ